MKKIFAIGTLVLTLVSCSVTLPLAATGNKSIKTGVAKSTLFLGFGNIDVSAEKAAKDAGIKKIATVDYQVKGGLFTTTYKTIVTGE